MSPFSSICFYSRHKQPQHQVQVVRGQNGAPGNMTVRILEKRKDSEHVNHRQAIQNVMMISVAVKGRRRESAIMALIILLNYQYFAMVDGMRGTTGASA